MRIRPPIAVAFAAVALLACGPRGLSTGPTVPTLVQIGGAPRAVITLTDVDDVRDIALGPSHAWVATDRGVLTYPVGGEATAVRRTRADGLPSDDVRAVAALVDGRALVLTGEGVAWMQGDTLQETAIGAPPIGAIVDATATDDGTVWACGSAGLARLTAGAAAWSRVGEPLSCTVLVETPAGDVWVGTRTGLVHVDGDVVREHMQGRGIPVEHVRDVLPLGGDRVLALVQGPSEAQLAFWDGERWFGYTLDELDRVPIGLGRRGTDALLLTPGQSFVVREGSSGDGVPLTALSTSERFGVRSYRARVVPADRVTQAGDAEETPLPPPKPLAEVPPGQPTIEAPAFIVDVDPMPSPEGLYLARRAGAAHLLADRNRGVVTVSAEGTPRLLRTRDLVAQRDIELATDGSSATWLVTDAGDVVRFGDGVLRRVAPPPGLVPQAIGSGPEGVYLVGLGGAATTAQPAAPPAPAAPATEAPPSPSDGAAAAHQRAVAVYRRSGDGWTELLTRTLTLPTELVGVPFFGVTQEQVVWAALRVVREDGSGERMRGVAVLDPRTETVIYHHRGASPAVDGEGALPLPDEISSIDLNESGMAWFGSLAGAVRVGNSQAVVFGESRGVRGEIVTDVLVGQGGRVWVAAAEGVGYFEGGEFEFRLPRTVQDARVLALAMDGEGNVWGAGTGAVLFDGQTWHRLTEAEGLPVAVLKDVEVDDAGRVWFLGDESVLLFTRP